MRTRRGIAPLIILLIIALLILVGAFSYSQGYRAGSTASASPGQATEDPASIQHTIYVVVAGHRDWTPLHLDHSANIHVDSVTVYSANPGSLPNGDSWAGFGKSISVMLQISGGSLSSPLDTTFVIHTVALGASWGQAETLTLPSGTYTITALGVDQGGYQSSASTTMTLQ